MLRKTIDPRPDWQKKVEADGLIWHTAAGAPYWNESAFYSFRMSEIEKIEKATEELYSRFLDAGEYIIRQNLFGRFCIPEWCWPVIRDSWNASPPALNYGRFDFGFSGGDDPKLFEFNCDTPTSLLEASVIQWNWKEDSFPNLDQYTSIHDKLVAKWKDITPYLQSNMVHFTHANEATGEDAVTVAYIMDTAREAGLDVDGILINNIGWNGGSFTNLEEENIDTLYKLYPWEWLVNEEFGKHIAENNRTLWIEPIWKMMWSNKAILPILWDMFPRHPNLLWASMDKPATNDYVQKPILSREGANVTIVKSGQTIGHKDGAYSEFPSIFQGLYDLPDFDGNKPVIGAWIVDGAAAGMGIREDGLITGNLSRFVPHIIEG